jgi:hypothetical protein
MSNWKTKLCTDYATRFKMRGRELIMEKEEWKSIKGRIVRRWIKVAKFVRTTPQEDFKKAMRREK